VIPAAARAAAAAVSRVGESRNSGSGGAGSEASRLLLAANYKTLMLAMAQETTTGGRCRYVASLFVHADTAFFHAFASFFLRNSGASLLQLYASHAVAVSSRQLLIGVLQALTRLTPLLSRGQLRVDSEDDAMQPLRKLVRRMRVSVQGEVQWLAAVLNRTWCLWQDDGHGHGHGGRLASAAFSQQQGAQEHMIQSDRAWLTSTSPSSLPAAVGAPCFVCSGGDCDGTLHLRGSE
jgi:hypothetical protein